MILRFFHVFRIRLGVLWWTCHCNYPSHCRWPFELDAAHFHLSHYNWQFHTVLPFCSISAGDFFEAWEVLLNHIQSAALSKNNEVSLAALKSFQEILQIVTPVKDSDKASDAFAAMGVPPVLIDPLSASGPGRPLVRSDSLVERLTRYNGAELQAPPPGEDSALEDSALWWSAWNTWYRTGTDCTRPPSDLTGKLSFIPSQPFLTALIQIFPALYQHIKANFSMEDLKKLGVILHGAVSVPISSDASPFILPSYTEAVLTSLQEAVLTSLDVLQKVSKGKPKDNIINLIKIRFTVFSFLCQLWYVTLLNMQTCHPTVDMSSICSSVPSLLQAICVGPENLQVMYPAIFEQLLLFVEFSCKPPQYGRMETKHVANAKCNQVGGGSRTARNTTWFPFARSASLSV